MKPLSSLPAFWYSIFLFRAFRTLIHASQDTLYHKFPGAEKKNTTEHEGKYIKQCIANIIIIQSSRLNL